MIQSWSSFYYVEPVAREERFLDFDEGSGELTAELNIGSFTFSELVAEATDAINIVSTATFSVTVDRSTRLVTISATAPFDLLLATGTNATNSIFPKLGFNQGVDLTGASSYVGSDPMGFEYRPQFKLQSYVPSSNYIQSSNATVNKSADGAVEVVSFGRDRFIEMDIKFITNLPMDGKVIRSNPSGLEDALQFLDYSTNKYRLEFIENRSTPNNFEKVILESSPGFSDGTGFKLKELIDRNLPDIYETGIIKFRVVE